MSAINASSFLVQQKNKFEKNFSPSSEVYR
jgi:hypothetical protein